MWDMTSGGISGSAACDSLSVSCPPCSAERILQSDHELCFPVYGGPTPEIKTGRELELVAVEIDP